MTKLLPIAIQGASFIASFAAIAASLIMFQVRRKFGTGLLASGFKSIGWGVLCIALGITIDTLNNYLQFSGIFSSVLVIAKEVLFVMGTYIIVIGTKRTGDKLESLTK